MKNHVVLISSGPEVIDAEHRFVCIGQNCWGTSETSALEAFANAKRENGSADLFITRVAHKSLEISSMDGAVSWDKAHDAKSCPLCTVGKGIYVQVNPKAVKKPRLARATSL